MIRIAEQETIAQQIALLADLPLAERVAQINAIRLELSKVSPFNTEPVDCVLWVEAETVGANDYNPNSVAPPEMELLRLSIEADGYTQPIVAMREDDGRFTVIDGFHRHRVGKECTDIQARVHGYLPVVAIKEDREDRGDRIASTIRHNRARGKHQISAMADIVVELKRRNWANDKIGRELGMDQDEVLRLCQITGLAELFSNQDFSASWDVEGFVTESDFVAITDDIDAYDDVQSRTSNTSDPDRIFHTHDLWECHKAGFYKPTLEGVSRAEGAEIFRAFLADLERFAKTLAVVIVEWVHSCEHYLTNRAMNRLAWLGQAAVCQATGIPASYRSGWSQLTEAEQEVADGVALKYLNLWLHDNGREMVTLDEARSYDRQSEIY